MKQATSKKNNDNPMMLHVIQRLREGVLLLQIAVSVFLFIALVTYSQLDPGWSSTGKSAEILNSGGRVGAFIADFSLYMLGYLAFLLPVMLTYLGWVYFRNSRLEEEKSYHLISLKYIGFTVIILTGSGLASLYLQQFHVHLPFTSGGIIGNLIAKGLVNAFNNAGATLFLITLLLIGVTWCSGFSWLKFGRFIAALCFGMLTKIKQKLYSLISVIKVKLTFKSSPETQDKKEPVFKAPKMKNVSEKVRIEPSFAPTTISQPQLPPTPAKPPKRIEKKSVSVNRDNKSLPSLDLLDFPQNPITIGFSSQELEAKSREVEQKLEDFGIHARVVGVHPGPVITRYELELAPGIKVSKLTTLAKDLARSLSIISVRIVEVIPGKSVVGIELPNEKRAVVSLREVLESDAYRDAHSPLSLALGKDIAGHPVIVDLAKMPHLLVAGTTGSGKSVGVNAMLMSILFKSTAEEVRLILVDPKMLELSIYDGIPHLLAPVVTDMKQAANALRWCVGEMDKRYRLMASLGVRNLMGYNNKVKDAIKNGQPIRSPLTSHIPGMELDILQPLPYIVVMIDEFADMMMVVGKKVEQLIARIAQKARAAGIHLILATQRPSVDVITGLIKANVPTRISYQVSSKIDSRTILDQQGAEQLLGHGDLLYLAPGTGVPTRVHGAFVADDEVHSVVNELKQRGAPEYLTNIFDEAGDAEGAFAIEGIDSDSSEHDPLYDQAVEFVIQSRKASISSVQRRFKIGYNRAARLIEDMENAGIVTPMESNGSREVLSPNHDTA